MIAILIMELLTWVKSVVTDSAKKPNITPAVTKEIFDDYDSLLFAFERLKDCGSKIQKIFIARDLCNNYMQDIAAATQSTQEALNEDINNLKAALIPALDPAAQETIRSTINLLQNRKLIVAAFGRRFDTNDTSDENNAYHHQKITSEKMNTLEKYKQEIEDLVKLLPSVQKNDPDAIRAHRNMATNKLDEIKDALQKNPSLLQINCTDEIHNSFADEWNSKDMNVDELDALHIALAAGRSSREIRESDWYDDF